MKKKKRKKSWQSSHNGRARSFSRTTQSEEKKNNINKTFTCQKREWNRIQHLEWQCHQQKEKVNFPTHSTPHTYLSQHCCCFIHSFFFALSLSFPFAQNVEHILWARAIFFFVFLHAQCVHQVDKHINVYIICAKTFTFLLQESCYL